MKRESLKQEITEGVKRLLDLARDLTFNSISENCLYIISEIKHSEKNALEQFKIKVKENNTKTPKPLADILPILDNLYPNFYDVNLEIYKAEQEITIIEIQYYPRTSLDKEYQKIVKTKETMLHSKVSNPSYHTYSKIKFDINWQWDSWVK